jgi:flagellar basal body rod protein FlgB
MEPSLFGQGTLTNTLRGGLEELSATQKTIASRIAGAVTESATTGFSGQLQQSMARTDQGIMRDMASLADTEMRYEAAAKLLQKSYGDLRSAITGNG